MSAYILLVLKVFPKSGMFSQWLFLWQKVNFKMFGWVYRCKLQLLWVKDVLVVIAWNGDEALKYFWKIFKF